MFYVSAVRLEEVGEQFIQTDGSWTIPVMNAWDIKFLREEAKRLASSKV